EMGEEQLGRIIRGVTGLEDFETIIPKWEDILVEGGIFFIAGVGISLAQTQLFRKDQPTKPVEERLGLVGEEFEKGPEPPAQPSEAVVAPLTGKELTKAIQEERDVLPGTQIGREVIAPLSEIEQKAKRTTVETTSKAVQASTANASVKATSDIDAVIRNVARATDALSRWGTAGKKVQRAFFEISARTAVNSGNTTQNIKIIFKGTTSAEKTIITQLTDGAISEKGQPARLVVRARALKKQLDIMQNQAIKVGLRKGKLTGRAFPQIANKKGIAFLQKGEVEGAKSHEVFAWAQNQVTKGKFKTVDSAIAALQQYRRTRLRGTEGYFEGARTIELDLDMREWNPDKVLRGIIEAGWENIEGARQWGVTKDGNFKSIRTDIERIRTEVGRDQANLLEDYIKAQYGQSRASVSARKWSRRARGFQFTTKLAPSLLTITRNMLDRYAKGMTHGTIGTNIRATIKFPPFLNVWMKTSRKIQDEMIRQGAVLGHGHLSEGFSSGGSISQFIGSAFAASEKGNQTYIAIVKKLQIEADIKRLHEMGGDSGTIAKMYDRLTFSIGSAFSKDARLQFKVGPAVLKFGESKNRNRLLSDVKNEELVDALASGEQLTKE
ncbi:hypothetical protein LCGC14_2233200, partial [marine sediment metagenome]